MDEQKFADILAEASEQIFICGNPVMVTTFRERGVMANDVGFIVKAPDGTEYAVTIQKMRGGW